MTRRLSVDTSYYHNDVHEKGLVVFKFHEGFSPGCDILDALTSHSSGVGGGGVHRAKEGLPYSAFLGRGKLWQSDVDISSK